MGKPPSIVTETDQSHHRPKAQSPVYFPRLLYSHPRTSREDSGAVVPFDIRHSTFAALATASRFLSRKRSPIWAFALGRTLPRWNPTSSRDVQVRQEVELAAGMSLLCTSTRPD